MIKFKTPIDKYCFLSDINRIDLIDSEIDKSLVEVFFDKRKPLISGLKDMRKSRLQKAEWIKHRWKILKGIKKFHRSIEGKKLHRNISSMLTSGFFRPLKKTFEDLVSNRSLLKSISSVKTHLYIESEYYRSINEEIEFSEFFEYAVSCLGDIEQSLFNNKEITKDQYEFLLRIVDKKQFHKNISARCGIDIEEINNNIEEQKTGINLEDTHSFCLLYETASNCLQKKS